MRGPVVRLPSLCGIEKGVWLHDAALTGESIQRNLMLHSAMYSTKVSEMKSGNLTTGHIGTILCGAMTAGISIGAILIGKRLN
jgi:hypothetical protein